MKLKRQWVSNLKDTDDIKAFTAEVVNSKPVLDRLKEIVEGMAEANASASMSKSNYEKPSWALEQADGIGYRRALRDVIDLLNT